MHNPFEPAGDVHLCDQGSHPRGWRLGPQVSPVVSSPTYPLTQSLPPPPPWYFHSDTCQPHLRLSLSTCGIHPHRLPSLQMAPASLQRLKQNSKKPSATNHCFSSFASLPHNPLDAHPVTSTDDTCLEPRRRLPFRMLSCGPAPHQRPHSLGHHTLFSRHCILWPCRESPSFDRQPSSSPPFTVSPKIALI